MQKKWYSTKPRDEAIKALLQKQQEKTSQRRLDSKEDRGRGSVDDTYTVEQKKRVILKLVGDKSRSLMKVQSLSTFNSSSSNFLRCASSRAQNISGLSKVDLNEGVSQSLALVFHADADKTTVNGHKSSTAIMRHKDPTQCGIGSITLSLMYRWNVLGEKFPNFGVPDEWLTIKLLRSQADNTKPMAYPTVYAHIKAAFLASGILCRNKTHSMRGHAAQKTDLEGCSEHHIGRAGKWAPVPQQTAMVKSYLYNLPRPVLRALAGFDPHRATYWLPRADIEPSEELLQLIPQYRLAQERLQFHTPSEGDTQERRAQMRMDASATIQVIIWFCKVLLQDAVFWMELLPNFELWDRMDVFKSDLFSAYAAAQKTAAVESQDPDLRSLERVVPEITSTLKNTYGSIRTKLTGLNSELSHQITTAFTTLETKLDLVLANPSAAAPTQPAPVTSPSAQQSLGAGARPDASPSDTGAAPVYTLSRGHTTVHDLWGEWTLGLNGGPAVSDLLRQYGGPSSCLDDQRFYRKRNTIIKAIEHFIGEGMEESNAVSKV
ncbi:unnamed protein product [Heterosigma akashiwo]